MAAVKHIPPDKWEYTCKCGNSVLLISKERPERLVLCWDCCDGVGEMEESANKKNGE